MINLLAGLFTFIFLVISVQTASHTNYKPNLHPRKGPGADDGTYPGSSSRATYNGTASGNVYEERQTSTVNFSNPAASQFHVNGTTIPEVNWDAGSSWSGLLPISSDANETRKLFFWFWPTTNVSNVNDLVFWTNGGPGCSSLEGFLQENGPISWSWGQAAPTPNPWSWTNLANVLWVEQPVGTGFSQGDPGIADDEELAAQLVGFLEQFLLVFTELKGSTFYLTGESFAGFYIPYIANYIYENPNQVDLDLKGVWLSDPTITYNVVQEEIPALRYVNAHQNLFPLNSTFMAQLQSASDSCGYTDYLEQHVSYPPVGPLALPVGTNGGTTASPECQIHTKIEEAVSLINPAFTPYRVSDTWPIVWSVVGAPRAVQQFIYFNRTDVQNAIHAPNIEWNGCATESIYVNAETGSAGHDTSKPSSLSVLPNVIEKSERTVIVHGLGDFVVLSEGTRIAIQNMTWNGAQGFQTPIESENFLVNDTKMSKKPIVGVFGNMHSERNLTYVEFYYSGHFSPQFVPWAAYQTVAYLLGHTDSPSAA